MQDKLKEGEAFFSEGKIEEARECFQRVIEQDPQNKEAYNNLGVIAFQQERLGEAADYFSISLGKDPFYKEAVVNFCDVLRASNSLNKAISLLERFIRRYPNDKELIDLLKVSLICPLNPDNSSMHLNPAQAFSTEEFQVNHQESEDPKRPFPIKIEHAGSEGISKIELRKFPYPYRAAFTIANDIDLTSWEDFKKIYGYLCADHGTAMGRGLGLPLSSSFYLFNPRSVRGLEQEFSYFDSLSFDFSPYIDEIEYLIQNGYLDAIHGFGSFTNEVPFKREYAERAYRILNDRGLAITVWSNHGCTSKHFVDFPILDTSGIVTHAKGDDPHSPTYHLDLTMEYGSKFIWEWFDGGISNVIGQDTNYFPIEGDKIQVPLAENGEKRHKEFDYSSAVCNEINNKNTLLVPVIGKDGSRIYNIRRFNGGMAKCNAATLEFQLKKNYLNELIQNQGNIVLYQHLGENDGKTNKPPYFSKAAYEILNDIASLYHDGILYIAPLAELLHYNYIYNHFNWHWTRDKNIYKIYIDGRKDNFLGGQMAISEHDLSGISFYSPDPDATEIYFGDKHLEGLTKNPSDYLGQRSISFPMKKRANFEVC